MKMVRSFPFRLFDNSAFRSNIDFTTQNRFYPLLLCLFEKAHRTKNISMVGQGNGRHIVLIGSFHQRCGFEGTIQNAKF